ncbi:MAG: MFS transporter [Actinomycetota bacterium]|nr:MFS transporter [Actinomycetota bacterium]
MLTNADFRRFWAARVVSLAGSALTYVALPVAVYELSRSPLLTALVAASEALPYVLFGLVAGALGDRLDRKRLMVATDVLSAAVLLSVPVAAWLDLLTVGHVLLAAFLAATAFVFFDAGAFGAVPALVGRDRIPAANRAIWGAGTVVETAAPAAAGAALTVLAATDLLAVDALTFLGSALLIAAIGRPLSAPRTPPAGPPRADVLLGEVRAGLRFLWQQPAVRVMTLVGAAQALAGGAFVGQFVVWADRELGVRAGDVRLGVLFAAWGVGSLLGTAAMPGLVVRLGAPRVTLVALPVSAVLAVATALAPGWPVALVLVGAWGAAYMLVVVNAITYRQQVTPEPLMSRVNTAGRMLSFGLGWPTGAVLGGVVSSLAGPAAGMLAGAAVLAAAAAYAWRSPLRRLS